MTFAIDADALEQAYRRLQGDVHPDRVAGRGAATDRAAAEASARVNDAYATLADPVRRANYLLGMHGVDAFEETDTHLPIPFLEAQLERRERAAQAADVGDADALEGILAEVRGEFSARQGELADVLARLDEGTAVIEQARTRVRELRFLDKVAEDVDGMLAALDD